MTDYTSLITSEHSGQPNFNATVALTANAIGNITALIQSLPALFDLDVAVASQLDIVGKWIGLSRLVTGVLLVNFFGFADDASALGFTELTNSAVGGRFVELGEATTSSTLLGDPEYRTILRAQIVKNEYDGNISGFETALSEIVAVPCLTYDPGTQVMMIVLTVSIDAVTTALLSGYDLLPRPAGVRYQITFPLASPTWSVVGTATEAGTTAAKPTGSTAWDSSAAVNAPFNHIYLSWSVPDATNIMMGGLAASPGSSPNYPTLNFALYTNQGTLQVYESGAYAGYTGAYAPGDTLAVYYDGTYAVYLQNNQILKVTTKSPGSLSPMFCLNTVGAQAQSIFVATG